MRFQLLLSAGLALVASAAPTYPEITTQAKAQGRSIEIMSDYFNMLARKVSAYKYDPSAVTCDLSHVQMPAAASALPSPGTGLALSHIALGRGTQNYTCSTSDPTSAPVAAGALATLFNASCIASSFPDMLEMLPSVSLQFPLDPNVANAAAATIGPNQLAISGHHFFNAEGTPFFDLTASSAAPLGDITCAKVNATAAPVGSTAGLSGSAPVAWLKLNATSDDSGRLREVYRLTTAGGAAPATCEGKADKFTVEYAALYWFYGEA
jgi:hypothetical protein